MNVGVSVTGRHIQKGLLNCQCTVTHSMYTVTHCSDFRNRRIVISFFFLNLIYKYLSKGYLTKIVHREFIFVLNLSEEFHRKILRKKGGNG